MKINLSYEHIKQIFSVAKIFAADKVNCIFDICTGVQGDVMSNKFSIPTGEDQAEMSFTTPKPKEVSGESYSVISPAEKVYVYITDLIEIFTRLVAKSQDVVLDIQKEKILIFTIDKKIKYTLPKVSEDNTKVLIPNAYNSSNEELFDPVAAIVRTSSDALINTIRIASSFLLPDTALDLSFRTASIQTQEIDGNDVMVSNGILQICGTDGKAIGYCSQDILMQLKDKVLVSGEEKTLAEFTEEFYEQTYDTSGLRFSLSEKMSAKISKLASVANSFVDFQIGGKFLSVSVNGLNTIYTTPIKKVVCDKTLTRLYEEQAPLVCDGENSAIAKITVADLADAITDVLVFDKTNTVTGKQPIIIDFSSKEIKISKAGAENIISPIEISEGVKDKFAYSPNMLRTAISAFGTENAYISFVRDSAKSPILVIRPSKDTCSIGIMMVGISN